MRVQLLQGEKNQIQRIATNDSEAHNLYLKGRFFWRQRTNEGLSRAIEFFKLATQRDENYAFAYSGLADCYIASVVYGHATQKETFAKYRSAALKSVELDESLAEAHNSLGISLALCNEPVEAEREFKRAIELNGNYSTAHHFYAQMLATLGRYDEAIMETERARELDPLSPTTFFTLGLVYYMAGQMDKVIAELENYREIEPNYLPVNLRLGLTYVEKSRFEEGIEVIKSTIGHLPVGKPALAFAYAKAKIQTESLHLIAELEKAARDSYEMATVASIYLALGMNEKCSLWLEKARVDGEVEPGFLFKIYPWFEGLWTDDAFRSSHSELVS